LANPQRPLLIEIRDAQVSEQRDAVMRANSEAAIRDLAEPANR